MSSNMAVVVYFTNECDDLIINPFFKVPDCLIYVTKPCFILQGLHQITRIRYRRVEEYWEPKVEGLERWVDNSE